MSSLLDMIQLASSKGLCAGEERRSVPVVTPVDVWAMQVGGMWDVSRLSWRCP